jgi:methylated-DNA-[protein]-cysteine S-methyltransferase
MDVAAQETLVVRSPIGPLTLTAEAGALTAVAFETPAGYADGAFAGVIVGAVSGAAPPPPVSPVLAEASRQLAAYFAGERREFDLSLRPKGTPFQLTVWEALRRIPYGETVTYGELAATVGRPTAARAVGGANHRNPLAIVVPCHRVIGADGTLTGYAGGLSAKAALLAIESGRTRI